MSSALSVDEKVEILMRGAADDRDSDRFGEAGGLNPFNIRTLSHGFGTTRIFRILLSNACAFSCAYCPMRAGNDVPRHAIEPEKLAAIFLEAYRRGWASGLFVTSGIPKNPVWAMDRMIALVERLRFDLAYDGYLHAKAVAGCETAQVERLALLVDRLSYNLETTCQSTLDALAPGKSLSDGVALLRRARTIGRSRPALRRDPRRGKPLLSSGITTQIVVGLDGTTDREILGATASLWRERTIHHPHFAAFRPIEGTPLEDRAETPALREHRLYEADHLVRRYGFREEELVFDGAGRLPLAHDPKLSWALAHPERFPAELTRATREELLRVPGLGRVAVERILAERRSWTAFSNRDLSSLGPLAGRAAGFLAFRGKRLSIVKAQPPLFAPEEIPVSKQTYSFSPGTFR
jgi:predicted DNA-binding helix-hairpin-helix protein